MPTYHPQGVLSKQGDYFYYSSHWKAWSRLLIRGGLKQGFRKEIAISLTPTGGFNKSSNRFFIKNEYIRIYNSPIASDDDIYTHVLPKEVFESMCFGVGLDVTTRLIDYDYLSELNLGKLESATKILSFYQLKLAIPYVGDLEKRLESFPGLYIKLRGYDVN